MKYSNIVLAFFWLAFSQSSFAAEIFQPTSFMLVCNDIKQKEHLMPLSTYEFEDDINESIKENYLDFFPSIAPITFKNFKKDFKAQTTTLVDFSDSPSPERYDPLVQAPKGCHVIVMATVQNTNSMYVNKLYWGQISSGLQKYFVYEAFVQKYLSQKLAKSDYRRFDYYIASGAFNNFSEDQKIYFLKYHGINEFNYAGVSIDLNREVVYYDYEKTIKDASPYPGATFEGGLLDERKFITFSKNKTIDSLATVTPFVREIKGQRFEFYVPKEIEPLIWEDIRYTPRMNFEENGMVRSGYIKAVESFYNLKTNIRKSSTGYPYPYFKVSFHENMNPASLSSYPGEVVVFGKKYLSIETEWFEDGRLNNVFFDREYTIDIPGKGKARVSALYFDYQTGEARY